ncbi:Na+/H+ antiporter NhaA [Micromonospora sp. M12]
MWANLHRSSYESVWSTSFSVQLGDWPVSHDLRTWVNSGLMTFFFLVAGLELRREFDIGELRERRRLALPMLAGFGGMLLPIAIYLVINAGQTTAAGWGAVMATDTALALGALAVFGPRFSDRLRVSCSPSPSSTTWSRSRCWRSRTRIILADRAARRGGDLRRGPARPGLRCAVRAGLRAAGVAAWLAVSESGVDPVVVGLVMGLLTYAYTPGRGDLQRASDQFRLFREQPTRSSPGWPGRGSPRRCRRTNGCRRSTTRGRVTWSCRSSHWRTPGS